MNLYFSIFSKNHLHIIKNRASFLSTPSRTRTHTLTSVVLCAIHYTIGAFVRPMGLEPMTPWLRVRCCHQLSYGRLWRVRPLRFELRTPWLKVRCSKNRWATSAYYFFCAPEGTRTLDPLIKSQVHLPTELRALTLVGVCGADPHSLALQASATTVSAKPPIVSLLTKSTESFVKVTVVLCIS